ncbi:hypothetical protein BH11PLA2_BH11PLA2_32840 [soil metagenome]
MPITVDPTLALSDRVVQSVAAWVESLIAALIVVDDETFPVDLPDGPPVYARQTQNLIPARDGLPCVIVCRTPGRTERDVKRLQFRDAYYPLTVILCEAGNQNAAAAPTPWVAKLRDAIKARIAYGPFEELPEFTRAFHDEGAYLDSTIWDQANVRAVSADVVIFCRVLLTL